MMPTSKQSIRENGLEFFVDVHEGHKTGFYLDQREGRLCVSELAKNKKVLNCFAYTGAFSIYAAHGGAKEIVTVETSEAALALAKENVKANGLDLEKFRFEKADVFEFLRAGKETYDLIVLDPPAFAPTQSSVMQASRGYKDINRLALMRLAPGGLLFTYSCSHHVSPDLFQKIVFAAAKDANVRARILEKTGHPVDHPISIYHPEGEYLKGLLLLKS